MAMPFIRVVAEVLALMRLKAPETIRSILVVSSMVAVVFGVWDGTAAATGYTVGQERCISCLS
jgi:hypothetical protein